MIDRQMLGSVGSCPEKIKRSRLRVKYTGEWIAPDLLESPARNSDFLLPGPLASFREQKVKFA